MTSSSSPSIPLPLPPPPQSNRERPNGPPLSTSTEEGEGEADLELKSDVLPPPSPSSANPPLPLPTRGVRFVVLNFTPSFFSIVMGTGILSLLIGTMPHRFKGQIVIATLFYALNVLIFIVFLALSLCRQAMFPGVWRQMIYHHSQSLFLGTFPMGLATIINATVLIAVHSRGDGVAYLAWSLWWIDALISVCTCFGVPMMMFHLQTLALDDMTAMWLLPIVPTIVAAGSGAIVSTVLEPSQALITIIVSYALWGIGMSLSFLIMAIYLHRLAVHKLPDAEMIVSAFLPLGPLGQGSFCILKLSQSGRRVFPATGFTGVAIAGDIIFVSSTLVALCLWGFGMWWLVHGISAVLLRIHTSGPLRHNMGFWGFIFPLGVQTAATIALGDAIPSEFFKYLSIVFLVCLIFLYVFVFCGCVRSIFSTELFVAPSLIDNVIREKNKPENK